MKVKNYSELLKAIETNEKLIEVEKTLSLNSSIRLKKGQVIKGIKKDVLLSFISSDGIALSGDNQILDINIQTSENKRAIFIDSIEHDLGKIKLSNLTISGVVQLITRTQNFKLDLDINDIDIVKADARLYSERPMKYGVIVYQGALTVYNMNPKDGSEIKVSIDGIKLGRKNAPVLGSGVFISGFSDDKGIVNVDYLRTEEIHSNSMIPLGQANLITGGIFILYGAKAKNIESDKKVVTYGTNDMVLDVWGEVENWHVKDEIISVGPSSIGFVNFGTVKKFKSDKSFITYGDGSRAFNQYDGTIEDATFNNILTYGNGSIGMQFSKEVGKIVIENNIETRGSAGETLVKGVIKNLKADAISVLEGGKIKELVVGGSVITKGDDVVSYHINKGEVVKFDLGGELVAKGNNAKKYLIENDGKSDMTNIK